MADTLRAVPGVNDVAIAGWPLLSPGNPWNGSISINAGPPTDTWGWFFTISPGWLGTMKMQALEGRDFNSTDSFPGEASGGTFLLRTSGIKLPSLAPTLRRLVAQTNPAYRVSNVQTQQELVDNQSTRERLLTLLALFFPTVALLLAAIGLYGVLSYSVLQREREIGIRIAIGARICSIACLVTGQIFVTVFIGAAAGIALGMASVRYVQTLLFGVKGTDPSMLVPRHSSFWPQPCSP